ncbi:sulfur oxidation c-type cytochrome SoxA [Taklimakanibacter lacteus]|uniref:sulfur oxidation c-type cytochrome SoxA n=1 Tax=Taklimakanibacter lacteus TaxID=2268456 RepID=UPI000E673792
MALKHGLAAAVLALLGAGGLVAQEKRSGLDYMTPETRAMQEDDMSNPGMLFIAEGEGLWQAPAGAANIACSGCHGTAAQSMRGTATRYPAIEESTRRPIDLAGRINLCRQTQQKAQAFPAESPELLALTAYVAHQSRGMPIAPPADDRLTPYRKSGRDLFERRLGQLGLSCAACHEGHAGQRLGGSIIPQAHPTAYPLYRLEWQTLGSLQRRLRNCMTGMRAEPFAHGAPELIALEAYLMSRATGLPIETPGVRP